jgi:hypothetical protein
MSSKDQTFSVQKCFGKVEHRVGKPDRFGLSSPAKYLFPYCH